MHFESRSSLAKILRLNRTLKTLVTGATGFIGRNLLGVKDIGLIHTLSRSPLKIRLDNVVEHVGDISNENTLKELARLKFNRVLHLAWTGLPDLSEENNSRNFHQSKRFLEVMMESGVSEINVSGSCLEYGDIKGQVSEDMLGSNLGNFGHVKLALLELLQESNIDFRWLRIFYAYGPHQHKSSLLNQALMSKAKGQRFVPTHPSKARDFIYISDVVNAVNALLLTPKSFGIFNIGTGRPTRPSALLNYLYDDKICQEDDSDSNPDSVFADIHKIRTVSGWTPQVTHKMGVRNMNEWFDNLNE